MNTDDPESEYEQIVDKFAKEMRGWNASARTIEARRDLALRCLREWGLDGFTAENVRDLLDKRQRGDGDLSAATKLTYFSNLRTFTKWAKLDGWIVSDPFADEVDVLRQPRNVKHSPRALTDREVAALFTAPQKEIVRDWMLLALRSGLRASEIAAIRGENVDQSGIYVEGKGGSKEVLPCHPEIWDMAVRYPTSGFWFPGNTDGHVHRTTISVSVGRAFRAANIGTGSIHRLRHTYATQLLRSGAHIRRVQKLMRHANLDTTARYTAVDEDELRAAVSNLPPLPPAA